MLSVSLKFCQSAKRCKHTLEPSVSSLSTRSICDVILTYLDMRMDATRALGIATSNKKLLGAPGLATASMDATNGAKGMPVSRTSGHDRSISASRSCVAQPGTGRVGQDRQKTRLETSGLCYFSQSNRTSRTGQWPLYGKHLPDNGQIKSIILHSMASCS